jgi:heme-degrading monooxygenase HmoA
MIARLAEHHQLAPDMEPDDVTDDRARIAEQPGFCGGYHLLERETGRVLSLTIWASRDALAAAENAQRVRATVADGRSSRHSRATVRIVDVAAVF